MSKTYQEVMSALQPQEVPQELPEEIPEELGGFRAPPQPGTYRFQAPASIENCFDVLDVTQKDGEGNVIQVEDPEKPGQKKAATYQRINVIFDGVNALTIIQAPAGSEVVGEPFNTRISNVERNRWVAQGVPMVKVSDLTYLIRALAPESRPRTNQEFIDAALKLLPNAQFTADVEWSGSCRTDRDAMFRFEDEKGQVIYEPGKDEGAAENRKGCGKRVYSNKWPVTNGVADERAQCECGAWLRPFPSLARFKA